MTSKEVLWKRLDLQRKLCYCGTFPMNFITVVCMPALNQLCTGTWHETVHTLLASLYLPVGAWRCIFIIGIFFQLISSVIAEERGATCCMVAIVTILLYFWTCWYAMYSTVKIKSTSFSCRLIILTGTLNLVNVWEVSNTWNLIFYRTQCKSTLHFISFSLMCIGGRYSSWWSAESVASTCSHNRWWSEHCSVLCHYSIHTEFQWDGVHSFEWKYMRVWSNTLSEVQNHLYSKESPWRNQLNRGNTFQ